jgi:tetratricopeptide (TPR) repeat protein
VLVELAETEQKLVDIAGAEAHLRAALDLTRERNGELHVDTLHVETRLGALLHATSRRAEGRRFLASALGKLGKGPGTNTPNVIDPVRRNHASALLADGHLEEADALIARDLASQRERGARGLPYANTLRTAARAKTLLGLYAEAQRDLDEAFRGMGCGRRKRPCTRPRPIPSCSKRPRCRSPAGTRRPLLRRSHVSRRRARPPRCRSPSTKPPAACWRRRR